MEVSTTLACTTWPWSSSLW